MLLIREWIKRFQFAVINDYLAAKEEVDWNAVYADMNRRKAEINGAIKKSLGRKAKRHAQETDLLLEKSWDEIMSALHRQSAAKEKPNLDTLTAELKEMMGKIISSRDFAPAAHSAFSVVAPQRGPEAGTASGLAVGAASAVKQEPESVTEAEAILDAEPVLEAESADEAEPISEAEPVLEAEATAPDVSAGASTGAGDAPAEEPEELEALGDAEEIPEAAEAEELEEIPAANEAAPDKWTDAAGEDIFALDFVRDSAVLAGLENNEDELSDIPQTPAGEDKTDDLFDRKLFERIGTKKEASAARIAASVIEAVNKERGIFAGGDEADDDIFNEELKIGESQSKKNVVNAADSSSNSENDFSDFKIEKPDFSILDEPAPGTMSAPAAVVSDAAENTAAAVDNSDAEVKNEPDGEEADEGDEVLFVKPLPFSFTFGKVGEKAADIHSADEPILEQDGLFVIAKEAGENVTKQKLNAEFQMLVDSVLK